MPDYFQFQRLILKTLCLGGRKPKEILTITLIKLTCEVVYVCSPRAHLLNWELELWYLKNLFLSNHATFLNYEGENKQYKQS